MTRTKKTRAVIYRVTEEEWQRLEVAASASGEAVNDWCRSMALAQASRPDELSLGERLIYEEVARLRYLLGHGLGLMAGNRLTASAWEKVKATADQRPAEIADALLKRQRQGEKTS